MNEYLERTIRTAAELGATCFARNHGLISGEMSFRQCRNTYGKWFTDAVANGRIKPCRIENGKTGTKWFSVPEILSLKTSDYARAVLIFKD